MSSQPARVADRLDLPRDPRVAPSAFTSSLHSAVIVCTSRRGGSTSRFSPSPSRTPAAGLRHLVAATPASSPTSMPVAEVVLAPDLGVGDRLPEALGRGADVDLEDLLHRALQSLLEVAEPGGPGLGVLAHPPVVDEPDRDGVQEVELLPAPPPRDDEAGLLEQLAGASSPRSGSSRSAPRARPASARPGGTARRAGSRRVGSASALNTSSTRARYVTIWSHVNGAATPGGPPPAGSDRPAPGAPRRRHRWPRCPPAARGPRPRPRRGRPRPRRPGRREPRCRARSTARRRAMPAEASTITPA